MSIFATTEGDIAARMADLQEAVRMGLVDPELGTIGKQAQLMAEHCIRLTPPRSAAQGRNRVQRDIEKIFHPVDPSDFDSPSIRRIIRVGDAAAWDAFARNIKKGPLAGTVAVEPHAYLHNDNRDNRGRAKRTNFVTLWPNRGKMRDLIASAKERVGWAKAGWLRGYLALGGIRAPDFVRKHSVVRGIFIDGRRNENPFVEIRNDTGWGKSGEGDRIIGNAMAARSRAMATYFNEMMRLASFGVETPWQRLRTQIAAQFTSAA